MQGAGGWVDVTPRISPQSRLYTWWSYRAPDWEAADKGRRLDHVWATADLAERSAGAASCAAPRLGAPLRPRAGDRGVRGVIQARR